MRKRWIILLLALTLLLLAPALAEVKDISNQCKYWVSEGNKGDLSDDSMSTAWVPEDGEGEARVMLPEGGAAWVQINWKLPPTQYTFTEYDENQEAIATRTEAEDEFACISQLLPLNERTRYISVAFTQEKQGLNKIRVYPEGELPKTAVQWEKPLDKCDLMVVSTHQDDEWLWFGAIIPYYDLVQDKDVQVVYMANCGRYRYQEALNGIAVSGVRTYPQFVGLKDKYDKNLEESLATWHGKDAILEVMVEQIRRFKPEVILTHDWNGEYGHPQHKLTSRCMEYAIEAAADPEQYPGSAEKYGAWQVKKLYRHLEEKGRIEFDWHVAYPEFGGRTGIQVATDSMNKHASQLGSYQVEDHGKYDNALFGLSYSVVGDDVLHSDLFENLPETSGSSDETSAEVMNTVELGADAAQDILQVDAQNASAQDAQGASAGEENPSNRADSSEASPTPARRGGSDVSAATLILASVAVAVGGAGAVFLISTRMRAARRRRRAVRPGRAGGAGKGSANVGEDGGNTPRNKGKQMRNSPSAVTAAATSPRIRRA